MESRPIPIKRLETHLGGYRTDKAKIMRLFQMLDRPAFSHPETQKAIKTFARRVVYAAVDEHLKDEGNVIEAAEWLRKTGEPLAGVRLLENAEEYEKAADMLLTHAKEPYGAKLLFEKAAENAKPDKQKELLKKAAYGMLTKPDELNNVDFAFGLFRQADAHEEGAKALLKAGEPGYAAALFADVGKHKDAGHAWLKAGEPRNAARAFELGNLLKQGSLALKNAAVEYIAENKYDEAKVAKRLAAELSEKAG